MCQDLACEKHCKFIFGSYVEAREDCKITNDMEERTVSGICLGPIAKFQKRYKIFSSNTGVWSRASRKYKKSQCQPGS